MIREKNMKIGGEKESTVLEKVLMYKFNYDPVTAESVAADLLRDDFPANGITTIGQAIAFLDRVHDELRG